jgi:hypothetical protein
MQEIDLYDVTWCNEEHRKPSLMTKAPPPFFMIETNVYVHVMCTVPNYDLFSQTADYVGEYTL